MADATGKMPDGLFQGNLQAYGNMPECLAIDVNNPPSSETDPFR